MVQLATNHEYRESNQLACAEWLSQKRVNGWLLIKPVIRLNVDNTEHPDKDRTYIAHVVTCTDYVIIFTRVLQNYVRVRHMSIQGQDGKKEIVPILRLKITL